MAIIKINGFHLAKMLENGYNNLSKHREEVNKLNVFPVADGDTGTNMSLTLGHGLGNSGVILSQLFKGLYTELARAGWVTPAMMRNALIRSYKTAYASVVQPVEGTILTVAREGIEHIKTQIDKRTTMEEFLSMYTAEMRKSLSFTPELLPVLKESGVIDSGAYGYILIFEGMLDRMYGKKHKEAKTEEATHIAESAAPAPVDLALFKMYGTSLVVVEDGRRVKVHIHTFKPAKIITMSQDYGEFLTFKLENMQLQHNEVMQSAPKKKPLATIAAVNGDGMEKTFLELGCDVVINCREAMNASTEDFIRAFSRVNAEKVVVLPNNKNVIMAADQAVRLAEAKNVEVLPTKSSAEGYFALAMDIQDSDDTELRVKQMRSGMKSTVTLSESTATKDYEGDGVSCKAGEEIVLLNGNLVAASTDWCDCIIKGLKAVPNADDIESCVIFTGEGVPDGHEEILTERLAEAFPALEPTFLKGDQSVYKFIIGISR